MSTKVTSKGQVTIPKRVRDVLGIKPGDEIEFRGGASGELILKRVSDEPYVSPFARFRGTATAGLTTDEIMAMTRGED